MKTNFKGTRGEWLITEDKRGVEVKIKNKPYYGSILSVTGKTRWQYDIKLVADAGNIRQQINCDLPELLEQRNKAVELLQKLTNDATFLEDAKEFLKTIEK